MIRHADITVERKRWGLLLYATVEGHLVQRKYIYYSEREARRLFRAEFA